MSARPSSFVKRDKGYKRYEAAVERALALFDSALQEWADYIAFLGRLAKALQTRPADISEIPHNVLVAKRLSQCLNQSLQPSVHQKALDIYSYAFSILDKDTLGQGLHVWLPGLAPVLSFASLNVKSILLDLFEKHIVCLNARHVRPASKSIILALLPGLEEEKSEEYDRTLGILDQFKSTLAESNDARLKGTETSGNQYFWQSFFLASLCSPTRRQGALAYLTANFPSCDFSTQTHRADPATSERKPQDEDAVVDQVTSPEPGLLIRCFSSGLRDDQVLIQRGFLDLLVTHLPLRCDVLQQKVTKCDLQRLVSAAVSVVLRRDMSLNRRLWSWFLGPEPNSDAIVNSRTSPNHGSESTPRAIGVEERAGYFKSFGLSPLLDSLEEMISDASLIPSNRARPFRICLSLMDRGEIGTLVLPAIFRSLMESLQDYQSKASSHDDFEEVLRSANVLFDGIESRTIWKQINGALNWNPETDPEDDQVSRGLRFVHFIVRSFNIQEDEMLQIHIPMTVLRLTTLLRTSADVNKQPSLRFSAETCEEILLIINALVDNLPDRTQSRDSLDKSLDFSEEDKSAQEHGITCLQSIQKFYDQERYYTNSRQPPFSAALVNKWVPGNVMAMVEQALAKNLTKQYTDWQLSLLEKVSQKFGLQTSIDFERLLSVLKEASSHCRQQVDAEPLSMHGVQAILRFLELIDSGHPSGLPLEDSRLHQVMLDMMHIIWLGLSPSAVHCNVEAARCFWRIHLMTLEQSFSQGSLMYYMTARENTHRGTSRTLDGARHFAVLWSHRQGSGKARTGFIPRNVSTSVRRKVRKNLKAEEWAVLSPALYSLLDSLEAPSSDLGLSVSRWLSTLTDATVILDHLIESLLEQNFDTSAERELSILEKRKVEADFDVQACTYNLKTISNFLRFASINVWSSDRLYSPLLTMDVDFWKVSSHVGNETEAGNQDLRVHGPFFLISVCLHLLDMDFSHWYENEGKDLVLREAAIALLEQLCSGPHTHATLPLGLERPLVRLLSDATKSHEISIQLGLLSLLSSMLKRHSDSSKGLDGTISPEIAANTGERNSKRDSVSLRTRQEDPPTFLELAPGALLDSFINAISTPSSYSILDPWVQFMEQCLPLYEGHAIQTLMALVDTLINSIGKVFRDIQQTFESQNQSTDTPEPISGLLGLLNGLETIVVKCHERLLRYESSASSSKPSEPNQGFFGNMVSGVIASESTSQKQSTTNSRLTVLLYFRDAITMCFSIWLWGSDLPRMSGYPSQVSPSVDYISARLKHRVRRLLEHLFLLETLECLEILILLQYGSSEAQGPRNTTGLSLLHVLSGSRPRNTIPVIFNAIYSRTNSAALDSGSISSKTTNITEMQLSHFLVQYVQSLENDAMDEIWSDCITFLRDVLANPLPHRQILPLLLQFTSTLGAKMSSTTFGEQKRLRRDLGDLLIRLLTATFTTRPVNMNNEVTVGSNGHTSASNVVTKSATENVVDILAAIIPDLSTFMGDADRLTITVSTISTHIVIPAVRSKLFPKNIDQSFLDLLIALSRIPEGAKTWRKDIAEIFQDPRFVCTRTLQLWEHGWYPVLRNWIIIEKERCIETISRIPAPTSIGIIFSVGAATARSEADKKAQLNLRRATLAILIANHDTFIGSVSIITEKAVELFGASATSSPSSLPQADLFLLFRALVLRVSSVHLSSLWPILLPELQRILRGLTSEAVPSQQNLRNIIQACKLLETLLSVAPDEFQLQEWLFITDTIDAVYRPLQWTPAALVDQVAVDFDQRKFRRGSASEDLTDNSPFHGRKPLLTATKTRGKDQEYILSHVIRPFYQQLSIAYFEASYQMVPLDHDAYVKDILADIFDETTLA